MERQEGGPQKGAKGAKKDNAVFASGNDPQSKKSPGFMLGNPQFEARNPKEIRNSKIRNKLHQTSGFLHCFCLFCDFEFPSDFGFRASDFEA
jgi:hypothetical protein